ncbi:ATP-dependent RNA helicase [Spironucleus salmonicida]|uniref:ATP-dependent RNA helicase n=1 Tax=Spironucleus salmonicida TaxID=348837 RepID=V6LZX0_9EUKA|nr:ATP-dependent RNA helicase [Spironucleus salmonicida]|eukprot:EST46404.1 Eukaryotic translation initiation factor 4A [Spironucleus salmonicida]
MNAKLLSSEQSWDGFGLPQKLVDTLIKNDFKTPSVTQVALYESLKDDAKRSGILEAPTGTGKTIAFVSHALRQVDASRKIPQVVIFVHTQILGFQILHEVQKLEKQLDITSSLLLGFNANLSFNHNAHIIVATPGAFVQNFLPKTSRGKTETAKYKHDFSLIVLDEADYYWKDTNQREAMVRVFGDLNMCQVLLFSATLDEHVSKKLVQEWLKNQRNPFTVKKEVTLENTSHFFVDFRQNNESQKLDQLQTIFDLDIYESGFKSIIFCKTRKQVDSTFQKIVELGYEASRYHGDMTQEERQVEYKKFLAGETRVLITTDMLARGIDIVTIALVINYEVPTEGPQGNEQVATATYVHRIGRGGRFGRISVAITFVSNDQDMSNMKEIQSYVDKRFNKSGIIQEMKIGQISKTICEVFANQTAENEEHNDLAILMTGAKGVSTNFKKRSVPNKSGSDSKKAEVEEAKAEIVNDDNEISFE